MTAYDVSRLPLVRNAIANVLGAHSTVLMLDGAPKERQAEAMAAFHAATEAMVAEILNASR